MREILFRGKRLDNDEWVDGWYCMYPFGRWPCKPAIIPSQDAIEGRHEFVEVDHETVGQFTGLTDKNGRKIFEGDIVKYTNDIDNIYHEEVGVCVFEQDESNFALQRTVKNPENYPVPITIHTIYLISNITNKDDVCYEVIGNRWDNSELLEGAS